MTDVGRNNLTPVEPSSACRAKDGGHPLFGRVQNRPNPLPSAALGPFPDFFAASFRYVPETLLKLVRDEGVTFSHCVPTIVHKLWVHPLSKLIESTGVSRYGVLMQVEFVAALARTSVGKLNKRAMREAQE